MKWLVEDYDPEGYTGALIQYLEESGRCVKVSGRRNRFNEDLSSYYDDSEPVFVYGSIQFCRQARGREWISFYDTKPYLCSTYYPIIGVPNMVNSDHWILPTYLMERMMWGVRTEGGTKLFVRPNSGDKLFTGDVFDLISPHSQWHRISSTLDPSTLLLCARPLEVHQEARFVVDPSSHKIVCGSTYGWDENLKYENPPKGAYALASQIVNCSRFCSYYQYPLTLDVAEFSEHGIKQWGVMEIGCVNCSGLYGSDLQRFVEGMEDYHENQFIRY